MDTYKHRMLELAEHQEAARLKEERAKRAVGFLVLFLCSPILIIMGIAFWSILTA